MGTGAKEYLIAGALCSVFILHPISEKTWVFKMSSNDAALIVFSPFESMEVAMWYVIW